VIAPVPTRATVGYSCSFPFAGTHFWVRYGRDGKYLAQ
jgi:hypothetical protein